MYIFIKKNTILTLAFVLLILSCKDNNKKIELERKIEKWQGVEIKFTENILYAKYGKDALTYNIPDANYKILLYGNF